MWSRLPRDIRDKLQVMLPFKEAIDFWHRLGCHCVLGGPQSLVYAYLYYVLVTYLALYDTWTCCTWMLHMGCGLFFSSILLSAFLPIMFAESWDSLLLLFIPGKGKDKVGGEPSNFLPILIDGV